LIKFISFCFFTQIFISALISGNFYNTPPPPPPH
jgi:hypothetical protein